MNTANQTLDEKIAHAVNVLNDGGVIAYPTEHCFGLGCDPQNEVAVKRLLKIKQRQAEQGVILIASNVQQIEHYVDVNLAAYKQVILASWPGPNTWIVPAIVGVSPYIKGRHAGVAVRVTANPIAKQLCGAYGGAIVSTSANRHGQPSLMSSASVSAVLGKEISYILDEPVGGADSPSAIRDGMTGQQIR